MHDLLRERVKTRLDFLGVNPFEAARRANFERSFVNDLLIGKKATIRQSKLGQLAIALECDPEYLVGLQGAARMGENKGALQVFGVAEAGAWRAEVTAATSGHVPLASDPRFPVYLQKALLVRGDHAAGLGILDGSYVTVLTAESTIRSGDIIAFQIERASGETEITIRLCEGNRAIAKPATAKPAIPYLPISSGRVIGMVISSHRIFGANLS